MAYVNWCVQNHIEMVSAEILMSMLGQETGEGSGVYEEQLVTRETLEMANCLLTLHLIHQTT